MKRSQSISRRALVVVVAVAVHAVSFVALADCSVTGIDADAVKTLLDASDTAGLDAALTHCDARDPALVAVYQRRRLALEPTVDQQRQYLDSLPTTKTELSRVYALVDTQGLCGNEQVTETVYGMFQTAAEIVAKLETGHRRFIQLCYLTDGELGESAWPAYDWLLENDPSHTLGALRSLPQNVRTQICGGSDPAHLGDHEAITQCRSGL